MILFQPLDPAIPEAYCPRTYQLHKSVNSFLDFSQFESLSTKRLLTYIALTSWEQKRENGIQKKKEERWVRGRRRENYCFMV